MANSLKISDEPPFTAADPRFREECIAQYNANKLQAATNKSGWATKKTYNPIQWDEASPAPRQLERVAQAEAEEEPRYRRITSFSGSSPSAAAASAAAAAIRSSWSLRKAFLAASAARRSCSACCLCASASRSAGVQ